MPRKNKIHKEPLSKELLDYLESGNHGGETIDLFAVRTNEKQLRVVWDENKNQILEKFIKKFPGYRPYCWWFLDAPEVRKRIGGIGKTSWEVGNSVKPIFHEGIPSDWSCVINGKIILRNFDKTDPPTFESEPAYLQRLNLLTPLEEKYLVDYPELLEPVALTDVFDFEGGENERR